MSHATYFVTELDKSFATHTVSIPVRDDDTELSYRYRLFEAFFRTVAERVAFNDCYDESIDEIVWEGRHVRYVGWQPGMLIEFADEAGELVYSNSFLEWDH